MSETAKALLALEPSTDHKPGSNWDLQEISVPTTLKDGEVLVEMVASGICHTDLLTTSYPAGSPGIQYPRIAGHEGSGYVKAVGPNVTKDLKEGDPVLLSFDCCNECESCKRGHPAYCATFIPLNILGSNDVFKSKDGKGVAGKHFGQSSFASLSVVNQASVLPARDLVKGKEDLQLFAPLGCGIQTGAGAVLNISKPGKDDRVMVMGLGGVGLSAIMVCLYARDCPRHD
jgi:Zn-dependent alcohol dehydrogenase